MSRGKAKKTIDINDFKSVMSGIFAKVDRETLDESPFAYKNLEGVINAQNGKNIEVVDKFIPIINIKGWGQTQTYLKIKLILQKSWRYKCHQYTA